jgi:hypothetical protein
MSIGMSEKEDDYPSERSRVSGPNTFHPVQSPRGERINEWCERSTNDVKDQQTGMIVLGER